MGILTNMLNRLTDNYLRSGNNSDILEISAREYEEILSDLLEMLEKLDVRLATGDLLKKLGENLLVFKGTDTDDEYRDRINLKIRSIRSRGQFEQILEGARGVLSDGFELWELWDKNVSFHPAGGEDAALLLITIDENQSQRENIKRLVAPGVRLYLIDRRLVEDDTLTIAETIYKNKVVLDPFPLGFPIGFGVVTKEEI